MRRQALHHIPLLDAERARSWAWRPSTTILAPPRRAKRVVFMAGGLGSRLQRSDRRMPKPMLKVGTRPLLETIVRNFID